MKNIGVSEEVDLSKAAFRWAPKDLRVRDSARVLYKGGFRAQQKFQEHRTKKTCVHH